MKNRRLNLCNLVIEVVLEQSSSTAVVLMGPNILVFVMTRAWLYVVAMIPISSLTSQSHLPESKQKCDMQQKNSCSLGDRYSPTFSHEFSFRTVRVTFRISRDLWTFTSRSLSHSPQLEDRDENKYIPVFRIHIWSRPRAHEISIVGQRLNDPSSTDRHTK